LVEGPTVANLQAKALRGLVKNGMAMGGYGDGFDLVFLAEVLDLFAHPAPKVYIQKSKR
jgi:hypothetical protein